MQKTISESAILARASNGMAINTALYRHFDDAGKLLYIGVAGNAWRRTKQHSTGWHLIDLIEYLEEKEQQAKQDDQP